MTSKPLSIYENLLDTLSSDLQWTSRDEMVLDIPLSYMLQMLIQFKALLEPFEYVSSNPGKDMRSRLIEAFNIWLNVPKEKTSIIARIVNMLHNASLL